MDKVVCNNCGLVGHIYKDCRNPVCSFGIIIFRRDMDQPKILMVQRKNSLCYIEFIRGKYKVNDKNYIINLFTKCSFAEKEQLKNKNYDELWKDLWSTNDKEVEIKDYLRRDYNLGKSKFHELRHTLLELLDNSKDKYMSSEWEFPKGRRNKNETNFQTAMREFTEETGYNNTDYIILKNISAIREEYTSNNNVNYRHIYNMGYLVNMDKEAYVDKTNELQSTEIGDIKWLSKAEALDKIRDYHTYRKCIINDIFEVINKLNENFDIC
tara:strand:- start:1107 stop:1910 length:804 start_codon:yes stop_codon:yes gene_type:complete